MLTSKEVYAIMKEDILELQRKRIKELEYALSVSSRALFLLASDIGESCAIVMAREHAELVAKGVSL